MAAKKSTGGERRSFWSRWVGSGRSCRYQRQEPESPRRPPLEFIVIREDEEDGKVLAAEAVTPPPPPVAPKNALLLMRCRSAPHNWSSSLSAVARGAVSLLPEPEPPTSEASEKGQLEVRNRRKKKNKTKGNWRELVASEQEEDEEEGMGWESHRPLVLARSRSDPARRWRAA